MADTAPATTNPADTGTTIEPARELAPAAERGRTTIADKVVDKVASAASAEVDQVMTAHSRLGRLIGRGLPSAHAVVAGGTCKIKVDVAVPWAAPLPAVAADVREHVAERVQTLTGLSVTRVDVTVADVVHAVDDGPRVR